MKPVFYILLAAFLTWSVSYSLGGWLLSSLRMKLYRSEERFLGFIAGSACLSTLVFLFTACGLARKWVFYSVGFSILAMAAWRRPYSWSAARPFDTPIPRLGKLAVWAAFAVYTWLYLGN